MLDNEASVWKTGGQVAPPSDDQVLAQVRARSRAFDRRLRRRDVREMAVAVIVAAWAIPGLIFASGGWLPRLGFVVVIVGVVTMCASLLWARKSGSADAAAPLADTLRAEAAKLDAQIRLLEGVLWWYLAPTFVGAVMIVAGVRGFSWFTGAYLGVAAVVVWWLYRLNQRAAVRNLRPRRAELQRLLDDLLPG